MEMEAPFDGLLFSVISPMAVLHLHRFSAKHIAASLHVEFREVWKEWYCVTTVTIWPIK